MWTGGQRRDAVHTEAALLAADSVIFLCDLLVRFCFFGLVPILQPENL